MKLIVGLGNPGPQYAETRHNVGFLTVERFAKKHGLTSRKMQFNALTITGPYAGDKIVLARPLTYMNESGRAVAPLVRWLKLDLSDLLVVYDELDLPLGRIRVRPAGSSGGHNGMKSVIAHLGSENFARLRIGIGRPPDGDGINFSLGKFGRDELPVIDAAIERAVAAVEVFFQEGLVATMNKFNPDLVA